MAEKESILSVMSEEAGKELADQLLSKLSSIDDRMKRIESKLEKYPDLSEAPEGAVVGIKDGEMEVIAGADEEVLTDNKEESDKAE